MSRLTSQDRKHGRLTFCRTLLPEVRVRQRRLNPGRGLAIPKKNNSKTHGRACATQLQSAPEGVFRRDASRPIEQAHAGTLPPFAADARRGLGRAVRHTSLPPTIHASQKAGAYPGSHSSRPRSLRRVLSKPPSHNGSPCNSPVSGGAPKPANTPPEQIDSNPPPLSKRWDKHPIISLGTGYKPRSRAASRGTSARRPPGEPLLRVRVADRAPGSSAVGSGGPRSVPWLCVLQHLRRRVGCCWAGRASGRSGRSSVYRVPWCSSRNAHLGMPSRGTRAYTWK